MNFLSQEEIDELLKYAEDNNKWEDIERNDKCDILIENISIINSKEIILLANKLGAQTATINFKEN